MSAEKRIGQQIRMVERLLAEYEQQRTVPLARFLTGFYKRNRQMGSKDRRILSRLVYHYFRLGFAAKQEDLAVRLAIAEFLCGDESEVAGLLLPELYPRIHLGTAEKVNLLQTNTTFRQQEVFPFQHCLSAGVDCRAFVESFFVQPDLFIRLRHAHVAHVIAALTNAGVHFRLLDEYCIALPNRTALDRIDGIAGKYEIQDYSSQQTGNYLGAADGESWWDACAGAGGKSLLLLDRYPGVNLLVSDTRRSILRNLDERFEAAGIRSYRQKIMDLTHSATGILGAEQFDGILLDAPCTGSGTWGRTPEMITAFDDRSIQRFASLQKQLAANVVKHLKPGKPLIYITCSVFADENEGVVTYLQQEHNLHVEKMQILPGYHDKADSMFVARLIRH